MGFLKLLHGTKKRKDLFDIACDYDGYDIVYEEETTDINLYKFFNEIITNSRYDITVLSEYRLLMENNTEDAFDEFYDAWVEALIDRGFLFHLDGEVSMEQFTKGINRILSDIGCEEQLDLTLLVRMYQEELQNYCLNGKEIHEEINYDILQSNVIARELRLIGYELISLFNGFDNYDKAVIPIIKIDDLKGIESIIK